MPAPKAPRISKTETMSFGSPPKKSGKRPVISGTRIKTPMTAGPTMPKTRPLTVTLRPGMQLTLRAKRNAPEPAPKCVTEELRKAGHCCRLHGPGDAWKETQLKQEEMAPAMNPQIRFHSDTLVMLRLSPLSVGPSN